MSTPARAPHVVSVTEAATRGVPRLVRAAEQGQDVVVERHGKAVAAMISMHHLNEIQRLESDLRESVLILARLATDDGTRTELDDAIEALGFDRSELEAELDADLEAGRE
ncbi:type II toxin-antitoxin system Phd/YefM family antitoxin [Occultella kanbiaonis]|uniref:type II toxin-antitoxin system Phd/YefM family antitoxin n=1 Tax=Occultella kanbiaonis TaxID=2675754 RepID=UPI0013D2AE25|nr:type II toxin-antitoxin system Phd/YefM family antitoxin [Occultella kanbiaonis]